MGKELYLTSREHELLVDLYDLIYLDVDYCQQVIYSTASTSLMYKRLQLMERDGFIKSFRLAIQDPNPQGRSKKVFTLDTKGVEEVRQILGDVKWDTRWTNGTPLTVYHNIELAKAKAAFQLEVPIDSTYTMYEWINENRAYFQYGENNAEVIRPDATLIIQNTERASYAPFMVELERSRQRKEVSINKLKRYNNYSLLGGYKNQNIFDVEIPRPPRIMFISKKENEMKRLMEHTKEVDTSATSGVLYTTFEKIREEPYGKIYFAKGSSETFKAHAFYDPIV